MTESPSSNRGEGLFGRALETFSGPLWAGQSFWIRLPMPGRCSPWQSACCLTPPNPERSLRQEVAPQLPVSGRRDLSQRDQSVSSL